MELTNRESIWPGKRKVSYLKRISAYCQEHGVTVPPAFHTRNTHKISIIDVAAISHKLTATTWYLPSAVEHYLASSVATGREFRIFNFKTGHEFIFGTDGKLRKGAPFNHHKNADFMY